MGEGSSRPTAQAQAAEAAANAQANRARTAQLMTRASIASVAVATVLLVVKAGAWLATDSVALLSSLVDSLLDVVASAINFVAVRHALTPADAEHRFGHGKAEAIAGLGQSAIIAGSAAFLLFESSLRLIHPQPVENTPVGIGVMSLAIVLTLVLVLYQRHVVQRTGSVAIRADSLHFKSDLLVNAGVIVALVLASTFELERADPAFAMVIALYVARSAWQIWKASIDMVMDRELPDDERARIRDIACAHPDVVDIHDLRTRSAGTRTFIQFHIELPTECSLLHAHDVSDQVEAQVAQAFPDAEIIIHADPYGIQEARADFGDD